MTVWIEESNLAGSTLAAGQAFIMQVPMLAFETIGVYLDIRCVAHAVSISEERIA